MTIDEFMERPRTTGARWSVQHEVDIRGERGDCPITAVAEVVVHEPFSIDCWEEAAAELDLDFEDAQAIVDAADMSYGHDVDLRAQLLAATVNR